MAFEKKKRQPNSIFDCTTQQQTMTMIRDIHTERERESGRMKKQLRETERARMRRMDGLRETERKSEI